MSENTDARARDTSLIGWLVAAARADVDVVTSERLREDGSRAARDGLTEVVALVEAAVGPGWTPRQRYAVELERLGFVWEQRHRTPAPD